MSGTWRRQSPEARGAQKLSIAFRSYCVVGTAVCARGAGKITIAEPPRSRPPAAPSLDSPPRGAPRRSRARDCWPRACAPRSTPTAAWPPRPASPHRTLAARPAARRVHLLSSERWVSARAVIIREVAGQDVAQVAFAEDEDMIQTLPPGRTDAPGATLGSRGPSRTWATRGAKYDRQSAEEPWTLASPGPAVLLADVPPSPLGRDRGGGLLYQRGLDASMAGHRLHAVRDRPPEPTGSRAGLDHPPGCLVHGAGRRRLTDHVDGFLAGHRILIGDRDAKWTDGFHRIVQGAGVRIVQTPVQAPNANAYAERFVRSIREECLDP